MKKTLLLTYLLTSALLLSACAGQASAGGFGNRSSTRALSPAAKLAIGTIKLEGSKQAINPALAAKLLPLWQLLKQVNFSDSAAPQEVTAVLDQIQNTMTPDQVAAIDAMQISRQDMASIFQQSQANGAAGSSTAGGAGSLRSSSGNRGNDGGGVFFGGGGAGGGGFGGGGFGGGGLGGGSNRTGAGATTGANGTASSGQNSAATAAQRAQAFESATTNLLVNQVIQLLESKIAS